MALRTYQFEGKEYYEIWVGKRTPDGRRLRRKTKFDEKGRRIASKQTAGRIEYAFRKELENESDKADNPTWEEWHEECLRRMRMTLKKGTVMDYGGGLKRWLSPGWLRMKVSGITNRDVFKLIFEHIPAHENHTPHIQQKVLKRIKKIFEMALEEGIVERNPARKISVKKPAPVKKVLNSNEANFLLRYAKECDHSFYYHWAIALFTGMRNGEIYALRWDDVDFETGLVSVNRQWTSKDGLHETKTNQNRVVPICPELKKVLLELKAKGPFEENLWPGVNNLKRLDGKGEEDLYFDDLVLPRSSAWRHGEQAKILGAFCRTLGIAEVKFHDLRATFITNLLSQGVALAKVMAIVGHTEMSTTNEYLRLAGVDVKEGTTERLGYRVHDGSEGNVVNLFG